MINPVRSTMMTPLVVLALSTLLLAGCGTRISKVVKADGSAPGGWIEAQVLDTRRLTVIRGGRTLEPSLPLALDPNDIIETGSDTGALIRFDNGGEVILKPSTRIRLGSLEVFFGEVLADLREASEVFDETLIAALGGTRFLFKSGKGRETEVAVLEGWVNCRSPQDLWQPIRLAAGHRMTVYGARRQPRVEPLSQAEIARIERWSHAMRNPARPGWCCGRGQVREAFARQCRGHFAESRQQAENDCQNGWCCHRGQVDESLRGDCRGSFHDGASAAREACTSAPVPASTYSTERGLCCLPDGRDTTTTQKKCKKIGGVYKGKVQSCRIAR